ncbi:MAG: serine/threonine protein kinase, partial [Acidobacteria bacterium]
MIRAAIVVIGVTLLTLTGAATDQWPQFRGPAAGVIPDDPALPETWSETENVVWKTTIPGLGWSSPVVWDDHIFLTSAVSSGYEKPPVPGLYDEHDHVKAAAPQRWVVYDVDFKTGKIRWERELYKAQPPLLRHIKNSYASETAVTDGERVYVYFGSIGILAAFDLNGKKAWSRELGAFNTQVELGTGASPTIYKDRIYVVNDNTTQSFLSAFDKRTGAELWRVNRDERGNWSTPLVWENELRTEIVTAGTVKVRSYDLDGKQLWELRGMTTLTIPSPFARNGLVYISSGYPGALPRPVYAIRPGASGDISLKPDETTNNYSAWYHPQLGTYNTSALVYGGYYYTLLDRGFLLCHDAKTGKQIYGRQRISIDSTGFTSSPWAYNG